MTGIEDRRYAEVVYADSIAAMQSSAYDFLQDAATRGDLTRLLNNSQADFNKLRELAGRLPKERDRIIFSRILEAVAVHKQEYSGLTVRASVAIANSDFEAFTALAAGNSFKTLCVEFPLFFKMVFARAQAAATQGGNSEFLTYLKHVKDDVRVGSSAAEKVAQGYPKKRTGKRKNDGAAISVGPLKGPWPHSREYKANTPADKDEDEDVDVEATTVVGGGGSGEVTEGGRFRVLKQRNVRRTARRAA